MKLTIQKHRKLISKVYWVALSLGLGSLLSSSASYAQGSGDGGDVSLVQAIQNLGTEINSLATAGANALSDAVYQFDQNLPGIVQSNTTSATLQSQVVANTTTQNLANIKSSLIVYPQEVIPPSTAVVNQLQALTYGVPSSDTLYSPKDPQITVFNSNPQAMPNNDDYFDIDSLLGPTGYSSDQQNAAQYYVNYLTQSYIPLGSTLTLQNLANLSYPAFVNFQRNNAVYQTYQAGVRSYMAGMSIALSNFNQLMAERTVQSGLGTTVGLTMPSENGGAPQPVADASPLQVQQFIATQRVNNAQWYKDMAAASPATVERETLFVLAEIEAQMQQLHTDNERLLATMSAVALASILTQKAQLQVQESNVNSAIQSATSSDAAANSANNNSSSAPSSSSYLNGTLPSTQ
ncbi:MAG TPA: hypothetical protein VD770_05405 [Coxiellaceae bacterium]|nr:hypothetical protein [Coxiellaceae bacterium]